MKEFVVKISTKEESIARLFKKLLIAIGLAITFFVSSATARLRDYDAAIAKDHAGTLPYVATSTTSLSFDSTAGEPFNFGDVNGSSTIEFIVSGDLVDQGRSAYLAVGENPNWSLRYEQWDDTGQLGFTDWDLKDYLFDPPVETPEEPTHVTYRWDQSTETMDVFVAGEFAGSQIAPGFELPTGFGLLGAKFDGGAEGMLGVIDRVTVYDDWLDASAILSHAEAFLSNGGGTALLPGDADRDLDFDHRDLVQVQIAGKYLAGQPATWGEGDWNGAPGGIPDNPPKGDGVFDQSDVAAALVAGIYFTGPYAAIKPNGQRASGRTSIGYDASTGEVWVDAAAVGELTSINIDSASGIFTGSAAENLAGSFDNDADNNIFKATFGGSFGSLSFGNVAPPGLAEDFLRGDITVLGSTLGGEALGDVDLIYVPEPSTLVLTIVVLTIANCPFVRRFKRMTPPV